MVPNKIYLLLCIGLIGQTHGAPRQRFCGQGEFVDEENDQCPPCPSGTFQEKDNHTNTDCKTCTIAVDYRHEVKRENCTSDSDTVRGCEEGYFISHDTKGHEFYCDECKPCSHNQRIVRNCTESHDTECEDLSPLTPAVPLDDQTNASSHSVIQASEGQSSAPIGNPRYVKTASHHYNQVVVAFVVASVIVAVMIFVICVVAQVISVKKRKNRPDQSVTLTLLRNTKTTTEASADNS